MSKRHYRGRNDDSEEEEADSEHFEERKLKSTLEDIRDLQKMRQKAAGLSAEELALGEITTRSADGSTDPLTQCLKSGGMLNLRNLKHAEVDQANIEDEIKQQFSKEKHLRDEDEEMRRYVEGELDKRKQGTSAQADPESATVAEDGEGEKYDRMHPHDRLLHMVAKGMPQFQSKRSEEMLSNSMLTGIPEVDLGLEAKIRNIEETESAKLRLLKEAVEKKKEVQQKTAFNQDLMLDAAKGYVQHNIYNIEATTEITTLDPKRRRQRPPTEKVPVVNDGNTPRWSERAKRPDPNAPPATPMPVVKFGLTVDRSREKADQLPTPEPDPGYEAF